MVINLTYGYSSPVKAIYFERFQGPVSVEDVPRPLPSDHGAVIEVKATGLCRSDWHSWMGHDTDVQLPHVPGHEFAGIIHELGSAVTNFKVGDRVTVPFVCGCGTCEFCLRGDGQVCPNQTQPGFSHWGSFAQYVSINHADFNLISLPATLDFETAAALGCRFATAFRGLNSRANALPGEYVAVYGCGGVGLSAVMIAKALQAQVIAIDINEAALAKARSLGADFTINAAKEDAPLKIVEITNLGAHVSIDALGSQRTANQSVLSLRRRGRHIQLGLLLTENGLTPMPMARVISFELDILGGHGMAAVDYPKMIALIESGRLQPQQLIERKINLDRAAQALVNMESSPDAGITIIDPWS